MSYRGRHRSGISRRSFLLGGGIGLGALVAGATLWRDRAAPTPPAAGRVEDLEVGDPALGDDLGVELPEPVLVPFARFRELELVVPAEEQIAICYHEAYYGDAQPIEPIGRCKRNGNRTKFDPPARRPGPPYIVMSSRGRGTPATSAVDVVLERRTPVLAPASGRVARVKRYRYECGFDRRIEIVPDDAPGLRAVVLHVDEIAVREGDQLVAGQSVLGVPRVFGFVQQVDYYIPGRNPHVHLEVKLPEARTGS